MSSLEKRTVLLTGVAGDIGRTYLHAFVRNGARVVATDLAAAAETGARAVTEANEQGPGEAVFAECDVTDGQQAEQAVALARSTFGGLDALVNNAAIYHALGRKRSLTELTEDDWELVLKVNVIGTWQMIRAAVPAMAERGAGRIVNIASVVTRNGAPGFAHYVASKAAVEGLTRAAARELGHQGITVNAVSPGLVDDTGTRAVNDDEYLQQVAAGRAVPRTMVPEDLVGAVLWLAGPEPGFITGQTLIVDGGGVFA